MQDDRPNRLNLGCGFDHREGYLNVDFEPAHSPDLLADVRTLDGLEAGAFVEIVAQDVLEHLTRDDAEPALQRWNELLAVGGTLNIRTTDVIGLCAMLAHHRDPKHQFELLQNLFGTQAYDGDYHLNGFTESSMRALLHATGFEVTSMSRFDGWLLDCEARKPAELPPLDLGALPLMDLPRFGADGAMLDGAVSHSHEEAAAISILDRAISSLGSRMPPVIADPARTVWRRTRSLWVAATARVHRRHEGSAL